jgi:hypothetical protein
MTKVARNTLRFALVVAAGTVCLFINDNMPTAQRSSLITQADAKAAAPHRYGYDAYGYYGVYPALADRSYGAYGSYVNRTYVPERRTLIPRHYGGYR